MEHLARWIRKDANQTWIAVNALFLIYATLGLLLATGIGMSEGWTDLPRLLAPLLLLLVTSLAIPIVRSHRRRKGRLPLQPLLVAAHRNRLAEAIGPNATDLDEAAADLEQATLLLPFTTIDRDFTREIISQGNDRMRRMLELSVAAPARYGYTRDQAEVRFGEDARWLSEFRRLVEQTRESAARQEESEALVLLRVLVDSRQEALAELRV